MLKVTSLTVRYGSIVALKNVSVHIKKGEFVALIGSNGAGKTTLLNAIYGLVVSEGDVVFKNNNLSKVASHKRIEMGLSLVPEGRRVFPNMTVFENLELGGFKKDKQFINKKIDEVVNLFPVLKERFRQLAGMLSGGEQQMLAIARALISDPELLLMDEPSMGLAPMVIKEVYEKLSILKKNGLTIFLVEQNAMAALKYADRGYVLENGKIVLQGKSNELINDNEIKRAYLGKEYKEKWER
ncbi:MULTISPECIES: ABC transporter ATP-binding protein [Calditerrivibrio]|jgi:branched-chain amino acid transport system ATP-binding protein|uniref:Branched-chain amino acid ABC transporter ATP-binding protein n=1 Tax=Calditerrivibrio nitroreducens TaxID=477976 RepID=A0A2J6WGH4_9BACT|nr:MAG: branched-chain amino acid ABC transporter ATP-binding protein [Calditerrivibrio nitroreducens]